MFLILHEAWVVCQYAVLENTFVRLIGPESWNDPACCDLDRGIGAPNNAAALENPDIEPMQENKH